MSDEEVFIGGGTPPWLKGRSQNERYAVWKRAKGLHSAEGNHLARAIELLGLPYAEPEPLPDDDPLLARMRDLIADPPARAAAGEAPLTAPPPRPAPDRRPDDRARLRRSRRQRPPRPLRRQERRVLEARLSQPRERP